MGVRFRRVEPDGFSQVTRGASGIALIGEKDAEIQMRQPDIGIQTERLPQFPLVLFGRDHWTGLVQWMKKELAQKNQFISPSDLDLVNITDSPEEVVELIRDYERRLGTPSMTPKAFT